MTSSANALLPGAERLTDWGLIRAQGPDAGSFLQGQLSNDVLSQAVGEARWAGYCSPKGRLLATFLVLRVADDAWWLACSADLLAATLKRLKMFVLRAKCVLDDLTPALSTWGLLDEAGAALAGAAPLAPMQARALGTGQALRLPEVHGHARWLAWLPAEQVLPAPTWAPGLWASLEVASGVARVVAATVEAFVPQMVNFELVGGVNFKKGCYPGQEVVARSQYRGTLKRRATLWQAAEAMQAGQEVFHSADPGQPAGMVVLSSAAADGRHAALVELKLEALAGGSLHLGSAEGPVLTRLPLPYELPAHAD